MESSKVSCTLHATGHGCSPGPCSPSPKHPTRFPRRPQQCSVTGRRGPHDMGHHCCSLYAQNYANQRISDWQLVHSGGPYGENLFWGYGLEYNATYAVNLWVSEKQNYDYATNTCATGKVCGHWCGARVKCNSGAIFIICNYNPAGNVVGQRPY